MPNKMKWPSIKDAKPAKKTNVKYYPGLGIAPVKQAKRLPSQRKGYNV